MAWRVIDSGGEVWNVDPIAERRANAQLWQLLLSFRCQRATPRKTVWAPYPIESVSKSALYLQADKLTDEALRDVLDQHLA